MKLELPYINLKRLQLESLRDEANDLIRQTHELYLHDHERKILERYKEEVAECYFIEDMNDLIDDLQSDLRGYDQRESNAACFPDDDYGDEYFSKV